MEKECYIVGAAEFAADRFCPKKEDFIIAADGGYQHLQKIGISPDVVVGDFDSLEEIPDHSNIIRHPVIKDDTDMLLAVKTGWEAGYKKFYLFGGLGDRLDHTLANIQVVASFSKKGANIFLVGKDIMITAITNESIAYREEEAGIISVFCHGKEAKGVTIKGLKYPLSDATITCDYPIGVSNEFIGEKSSIEVKEGTLIITRLG